MRYSNGQNTAPELAPLERLAYWYFRLNGFLTIENLLLHPDRGGGTRTDADLVAVRFSGRRENHHRPMRDDPRVAECPTLINVIIAELKKGFCSLNGPWTDPGRGNMQRALETIGCLARDEIDAAADSLYREGIWSGSLVTVRLFAIGDRESPSLSIPTVPQITWDEMVEFCIRRFQDYRNQKSALGQWATDGQVLRELAVDRRHGGHEAIRDYFSKI